MRFIGIILTLALPLCAQYSVHRDGEVVHLEDAKNQTVVSILTSVGDRAYEMKVKGQNVLFFPYATLDEFKAKPGLSGIPFLGPWANRMDEQAFYANGKKYNFNMTLGNVTGAIPIHGFLSTNPSWEVVEAKSDNKAAWVTSRLDFYKHPDWMEQWPFAHTIEITYRLSEGVLEVRTRIMNLSTDPMPIAIGYHPYYQLTDSKREDWVISVGAKTQYLLTPTKVPSGETEPIEKFFPDPKNVPLKDYNLDHVFSDLIRDSDGRAHMSVTGKKQKLEILFGPKFYASVIFAPNPPPQNPPAAQPGAPPAAPRPPQNRNFVCFEPMAGITDSVNLAQKGLYKEQQFVAPGAAWQESFWIKPSGF